MRIRCLTLFIVLIILQSCSEPAKKNAACDTCAPIPIPNQVYPPIGVPPYKPPTKAEIRAAKILKAKRRDSLRRIDFRDSVYRGQLNYPYNYVPWMGRRGPGYIDAPIPRTSVDTIMRIENHDMFMGQVMTNRNPVSVINDATFRHVDFNCYANFGNIRFRKSCYFDGTVFHERAEFRDFRGEDLTLFNNIGFVSPLIIESASFKKLDFSKIKADSSKITLWSLTFGKLTVEDCRLDTLQISGGLGGQLVISKSRFNQLSIYGKFDTLMLSNVAFAQDLSLTSIEDSVYHADPNKFPVQRHALLLHGVDLSKIDLDYTHFKLMTQNIDGRDLPPNELRILYEGLLKNFKDRGRTEGYELLDIEYRKYRDASLFKWQSSLSEWWWNFGYDPILIFRHILFFLAVFSGITFFFLETLQKNVYALEAFSPADGTHVDPHPHMYEWKSFRKFFRRLWFSIAYTAVVFLLLSIKIEHLKLKSKGGLVLGTVFVILMHITGLICLGYVANFILQK